MKTIKRFVAIGGAALLFGLAGPAQAQSAPACGDMCHADILSKANGAATGVQLTQVLQAVTALRADVAAGARTRQVIEIDMRDWPDNQVPFRCDTGTFGSPFTGNGLYPVGACFKTDVACPKLSSPADPQGGEVLKFRTVGVLVVGSGANYSIRKLLCESYYAK